MDQLAVSLFPLAYAGYAQFRIKNYQKVQNKQETIGLKVQIGFQLQIALLQLIELLIALFYKDIVPAACCLFLIVGLFYSFGITVIFHYEPLLALLPLVCLFNLISNSFVLKIFDALSLLMSTVLALYQHQRKDDPMAYNPFCEFFEQNDSFICQYILLLKFQPNTYQEEIELLELKENKLQDPLLATSQSQQHSQSHTTSQMAQFIINQTRQSAKLDQKHIEPAIMDIVFSKDDDSDKWERKIEVPEPQKQNHHDIPKIQVIVEENSGSDNKSQGSFKQEIIKEQFIPIRRSQASERRSSSLREIKKDHLLDEEIIQQEQLVKSDDEKQDTLQIKKYEKNDQIEEQKHFDLSDQEQNNLEKLNQDQEDNNIVEIVNINKLGEGDSPQKLEQIPNKQSFPFIEDDEYPNKLIVIPQQIQQELQQSQKQKKKRIKDEGLIAKRNRMMKRIKSYEEFQDKNDDNKSQCSDKFDDKKSDYEKYKDEVSSATLSEDESESGVYVQQKMEKVQFQVGRQITKKIVNYQVKHLISITVKVQSESWTQLCQYVELYQIANGHLPKPTVGDADIEKKLFYIQQWLDGMSQNPLLMRKEVLEYFKVPETIVNKYGLIKKIEEEKRVSRPSNKFMNSTQKDYFLKIKQINVDCLGPQTSEPNHDIIYFKLRFTIQFETKKLLCECLKTLDDIKEATRIIQAERNLRVSLQEHETSKKQIQAIVQFLQELFSHQFYYCDRLFEQFDLLALVK